MIYQKKNKNWGELEKFIKEHQKLYYCWNNMKTRCYNKNSKSYKDYGSRDIIVCDRWLDFKNFVLDMESSFKKGLTLDRINNNKGYSKENCRWSTRVIQNNNKRNTHKRIFNGLSLTLANWSKKVNIKESTLYQRFYVYGWSIEKCLSVPVRMRSNERRTLGIN